LVASKQIEFWTERALYVFCMTDVNRRTIPNAEAEAWSGRVEGLESSGGGVGGSNKNKYLY